VWELTLRCDLSCHHCGSRAGQARPDELSLVEALNLVAQLAELWVSEVDQWRPRYHARNGSRCARCGKNLHQIEDLFELALAQKCHGLREHACCLTRALRPIQALG
jgi:hypothetical protein